MKRGKGCAGKTAHRTRAEADDHAGRLRRQTGSLRVEPYWCSVHGAWHVGNRPLPRAKRRRY